jgi:hypothetical protein
MNLSAPRNAPDQADAQLTVRVTHPFHPDHDQQFAVVTVRNNWSDRRVYYHDRRGQLVGIPAGWTDLEPPDPVVTISAGRSAFRLEDLLELVRLMATLEQEVSRGR